jgi:tetratricopeptide (TPR) repeat protein
MRLAGMLLAGAVAFGAVLYGPAVAEPRPEVDADTLPKAVEARRLLKAKAYDKALPLLQSLVADGRESADIQSNLGFALRKLGDLDRSYRHYQIAIGIDPEHLGAREYLGELYLMRSDVASARRQLAILERLCPDGCEEREELIEAIRAFEGR